MAFVQKAVARLHEPEKLDLLIKDLGRKHVNYGAKKKYVQVKTLKKIAKQPGKPESSHDNH